MNERFFYDDASPLFANPVGRWRDWFAWRPVHTFNGGWIWLRKIQYRACAFHNHLDHVGGTVFFQYRLP